MKLKKLQKYWYSKFEQKRSSEKVIPIPKFPSVIEYNCDFTNEKEFNQVCVDFLVDYYIPENKETKTINKIESDKLSFWHSFTQLLTDLVN